MEEACAVQEIAQARSFKAVFAPFNFRRRTSPGLPFENRPIALNELPVEGRIVCDDDDRVG
jgi:hypothetical protein